MATVSSSWQGGLAGVTVVLLLCSGCNWIKHEKPITSWVPPKVLVTKVTDAEFKRGVNQLSVGENMATSLDKYHAALDLHKQINADRESWVVEKAGLEKSATVRRLYLYIIGRPKTQLGIAFTKEMSKDKDRDTQIVALQNLGEYKLINDGSGGSGANSRPR